ncbi:MAG: XdhC family protein, partial [Myxococcota bacterium]
AELQRTESSETELLWERGTFRLARRDVVAHRGPYRSWREGFAEHCFNHRRIAILGGGHCGLALSRTMRELDYRVTVVDTRTGLETMARNEAAHARVTEATWEEGVAQVTASSLTHWVVMTSHAQSDVEALVSLASLPAPFKGLMGSVAKLHYIQRELESRGYAELWPNLTAPVGLPMTSDTPAEIAISIAAQLLRLRPALFPWERSATVLS